MKNFLFHKAVVVLVGSFAFSFQLGHTNAQFYRPGYQQRYYQPRYQQPYRPPVYRRPTGQPYTPLVNPYGQKPPQTNLQAPIGNRPYNPAQQNATIRTIEANFSKPSKEKGNPFPRLSGEFEKQSAILLSVSDLQYQHNAILQEIVKKSAGHNIPLVILFNDEKQLKSTVKLLDEIECDLSHVSLYELNLDTIWLRDFGPRLAETENGSVSMDFFYNGQRPKDDRFPTTWGKLSQAKPQKVEWTLQGGNLLSNGKGLALVTTRIFEDNYIRFPNPTQNMNVEYERRKIVVEGFKKDCNIDQLMILEPLHPEATRHVDMFATFLAADHVLVAKLDPRKDPSNARILDENAKRLSQIKVDGKPMRVDRIMIPPRQSKYWSPYTNIIFANDLVLMPVYDSDPPALIRNAVNTYKRLLPGVAVETVNMTSMQKLEGALHCMTSNVPSFARLPNGVMSMEVARRKAKAGYKPRTELPSKIAQNRKKASSEQTAKVANPQKPQLSDRKNGSPVSRQAKSNPTDSTMAAVMTYRRKFVDKSKRFEFDAYAIGIASSSVVLLNAMNNTEIVVGIDRLCEEDQNWLRKNTRKILSNGAKVRQFVFENSRL